MKKRASKNQRPNKGGGWLPRTGPAGAGRLMRMLGQMRNPRGRAFRRAAVDYANRTSASKAAFVYNVAERTITRWRKALKGAK